MRLVLDFEPCAECAGLMRGAGAPGADPARLMRHLTYCHPELLGSLAREAPSRAGGRPSFLG